MPTTIKLPDDLIKEARRFGAVYSRSIPKQIEYWSHIGKIAEDNPGLPFDSIKKILMAKQEFKDGKRTRYKTSQDMMNDLLS